MSEHQQFFAVLIPSQVINSYLYYSCIWGYWGRAIPAGTFSLSSFKQLLNLPDNQEANLEANL